MDALVIGKPNAGKSLFVVNFAAYLGLKDIRLEMIDRDGVQRHQRLPLDRARRQLVSRVAHKTGTVQSIEIDLAYGKTRRTLTMTDTVGIGEGIHQETAIRRAMAETLDQLGRSQLVLHLVDASAIGSGRIEAVGPVDDEIARYASLMGPYAILANKLDVPGAGDGLQRVRDRYRGLPVIGISALTRRGFREVKAFVFRHLA